MARYRPKEGYIELWRRLRGSQDKLPHRFWPETSGRRFTELEAWIDLLFDASYKARSVSFQGRVYDLKEGELITSQPTLAARWKWSRGKVRLFLDSLYLNGEAVHEEANQKTKITIVKKAGYVNWQPSEKPDDGFSGKKGVKKGTTNPSYNKVQVLVQDVLDKMGKGKKKGD